MEQQAVGNDQIRSELRGHHWVAWLTEGADAHPVQSVLIVGRTQEEAESRLRAWKTALPRYVTAPR